MDYIKTSLHMCVCNDATSKVNSLRSRWNVLHTICCLLFREKELNYFSFLKMIIYVMGMLSAPKEIFILIINLAETFTFSLSK